MFCPNCGKPEQTPESYCRQCGSFLPDLTKPQKKRQTPEEHVRVNTVFSSLTIVACFTLAILLYTMVAFRPDTHPLIYVTAALLIAMGCWHIQTLWRTLLLRKHFRRNEQNLRPNEIAAPAARVLDSADTSLVVPTSVTERTTRDLYQPAARSTQTEK